jgi:hypothetical protein
MADKEQFLIYLTALAKMVPGFILTKEIIFVFSEAAEKISYLRATLALKQMIAERSSRDPFPSVADLLGKIEFNHLDSEEVSAKIYGAISRFGPYRSADARVYLGELAWNIVTVEGGWEGICALVDHENAPILRAQWRKFAAILIRREKEKKMDEIGYFHEVKSLIAEQMAKIGANSPLSEPS